MRSGRSASIDLGDLLDEALLAAVHRHAEAGLARLLHERRQAGVVEAATAARARAGDVDADHAARGVADRLLDDDLVLAGVERAVHHQDHARAHLRVLERARSTPRSAARMMWSRSRSPPRLRFIGLKRTSQVVMRCER